MFCEYWLCNDKNNRRAEVGSAELGSAEVGYTRTWCTKEATQLSGNSDSLKCNLNASCSQETIEERRWKNEKYCLSKFVFYFIIQYYTNRKIWEKLKWLNNQYEEVSIAQQSFQNLANQIFYVSWECWQHQESCEGTEQLKTKMINTMASVYLEWESCYVRKNVIEACPCGSLCGAASPIWSLAIL